METEYVDVDVVEIEVVETQEIVVEACGIVNMEEFMDTQTQIVEEIAEATSESEDEDTVEQLKSTKECLQWIQHIGHRFIHLTGSIPQL